MKIITIESRDYRGNFTLPCLEVEKSACCIHVLTERIEYCDGEIEEERVAVPCGSVVHYESLADYAFRNHIHVNAFYPPHSSNDDSVYMIVRSRSGKKSHRIMGWSMAQCFGKLIMFVESGEFKNFL